MTDQVNDIFDNKDQPKPAEQQTTEKPASSDQEPKPLSITMKSLRTTLLQ